MLVCEKTPTLLENNVAAENQVQNEFTEVKCNGVLRFFFLKKYFKKQESYSCYSATYH